MTSLFKKNNQEHEEIIRNITFSGALPNLILKGEKNTTWRIDEPVPIKRTSNTQGIKVGDKLSLRDNLQFEFAKAVVNRVTHTTMGSLKREDFDGHEKYSSRDEMYNQFGNYYHIKVNDDTKIVVIKFTVLKEKTKWYQ
jgi:hypothetical protein